MSPDISPEERAAWLAAGEAWGDAVGLELIDGADDDMDAACGVFVVSGADLDPAKSIAHADGSGCRYTVRLIPGRSAESLRVQTQHELWHVLAQTNGHSSDPRSVAYAEYLPDRLMQARCACDMAGGQQILPEDAAVVARRAGAL